VVISVVCLFVVVLLHVLGTRPGTWQLQKRALMHLATVYLLAMILFLVAVEMAGKRESVCTRVISSHARS
jgi:hypothetical protein